MKANQNYLFKISSFQSCYHISTKELRFWWQKVFIWDRRKNGRNISGLDHLVNTFENIHHAQALVENIFLIIILRMSLQTFSYTCRHTKTDLESRALQPRDRARIFVFSLGRGWDAHGASPDPDIMTALKKFIFQIPSSSTHISKTTL